MTKSFNTGAYRPLTIDFLKELEPHLHKFDKYKVIDDKLISCSPFRPDQNPSFVVFLDGGNWVDSGMNQRGNFIDLLSFLSGDDTESIRDYLLKEYADLGDVDELSITMNLNLLPQHYVLYQTDLPDEYKFRHPYLTGRGISEAVQQGFKIGYDKHSKAVVIPWTNKEGQIVRLMYRSTSGKSFWYSSEGDRIKNHLFGLQHVHRKGSETVWIVEAPIDSMYLWSNGIASVATGTASISDYQLKLLKQSPIETLVIASDNDEAGEKFGNTLKNKLGGHLSIRQLKFPPNTKDVNDLSTDQLNKAIIQNINCFNFK